MFRMRALLVTVGVLLAAPVFAQNLPSGFSFESVVGGPYNGEPIGFEFLPDGRILILERNSGNVRLAAAGAITSSIILTIPNIEATLERGLLGVAVDPAWPTRPYLYFFYTHNSSTSRIEMYTASGDLTDGSSTNLSLGSPYLLLSDIPDNAPLHNAGTLRFGPNDMLYASLGDDLVNCNAQDLTALGGCILRLDVSSMPGFGSGPPPKADITPTDNPFPGPNANEQLMYGWGLRNPFRFDIDQMTGDLLIGDVGFVTTEEVNWIPAASGGGQNFGWPIWEGTIDPGIGLTCGENNTHTFPAYEFPHGPGSAAVIGGAFFRSGPSTSVSLPPSYDGSYFFAEFISGKFRRIVQDAGSWDLAEPVLGQPTIEDWATGISSVTDMRAGPDGALYLVIQSSAGISRGVHRIVYDQTTDVPSLPPAAVSITAWPNPARVGSGVTFSWNLPRAENASLEIFDVAGRRVRTLIDGVIAPTGSAVWDGTPQARAGVYFYRLTTPERVSEGKLTLLR